jgi:DNA helicase II / ATP-dependent DNA helicase PcrA
VVEALLASTGFREALRLEDEKDFRTRQEMVDEFVSSCVEHDASEPAGLLAFLQDLSLLTDADTWNEEGPVVTLMTCHSAKGLEFDTVYLVGMEEGLLPHAASLDSEGGIEEERRLCYVAMTRARKRLVLTAAETRALYGEHAWREPSRFLKEIPKGALKRFGEEEEKKPDAPVRIETRREPAARSARPAARPATASTDSGGLKTGTRVRHGSFGTGVVMYTSGTGPKLKARIRFDTGRTREFLVNLAPIEILGGK